MNNSKQDAAPKPSEEKAPPPEAEQAQVALVARLSQMFQAPARQKVSRSLQPTPEAAKSRLARLRRKQRMLIRKSKRVALARSTSLPPAPDPLSP
jgi:crotonobetainyl-CoA:carnitine CoA-transferase CaiB-like acyl-CoA transferase